jgi:hypothetical protein
VSITGWPMGGEKIMTDSEIRTKIEHLEAEVAELEEEKELTK